MSAVTIFTERLVLHPVDETEARRISDRAPAPGDRWAVDYPFDGDLAGLGAYLDAVAQHGEQRPFGYYTVSLRPDGIAIGGIGFKGPPQNGVVEIGYGLTPSARSNGYATEALRAIVDLAAALHVITVRADTDLDNVASQRVLEKAGFRPISEDREAKYFEIDLQRRSATSDQ
jgi:RimJ/RimL family protein N-acetyltransferase